MDAVSADVAGCDDALCVLMLAMTGADAQSPQGAGRGRGIYLVHGHARTPLRTALGGCCC